MGQVRWEVVRSTAKMEALAPAWVQLWERDVRAKPFQHPGWLVPWWHHFSQPELRVLAGWAGETLVAVLPTYVYREPVSGERQLLLLGAGTSDYLDGVFAPECSVADVLEGFDLLGNNAIWEVARFAQIVPGSVLFRALDGLESRAAERYAGESTSRCRALPVAELPGKVRADVRYFRNFAASRGRLELTVAREETVAGEMFEQLVRLHTAVWAERGEAGVLADPAVLGWHREALPGLLAKGLLRMCSLRLEAEVIAVLYSLIDPVRRPEGEGLARTQYFYLIGHSTEHADLHPGTLLTAMAMERAAEDGIRTIDMLRGDEPYKRFWRVERVRTYGFAVRRAALRGASEGTGVGVKMRG